VKLPRIPLTVLLYSTLLFVLSAAILLPGEEARKKSCPASAWIVRYILLSRTDIDRAISDLSHAGIERVFLQVSGRYQSFFPSTILTISEELDNKGDLEDPFKYFIKKAGEKGIAVHAWVNVLFAWSKPVRPVSDEHPFNLHPDWFVHDGKGEPFREMTMGRLNRLSINGYFVSPAEQGVVNLMGRYVEEIVTKYDVQGIHLDYIRYPARGSGLGPAERTLFGRRHYTDPLLLETERSSLVDRFGEAGVQDLSLEWNTFRAGLVTELVRSLKNVVRKSGQDVLLSAAVFPDPDTAKVLYGQDWPTWIDDDLVDFVVIMNYTPDMEGFVGPLEKAKKSSDPGRIVVGVSTYNQPIENAIKEANFALDWGFESVCFFSYNDIAAKPKSLERIRDFVRGSR